MNGQLIACHMPRNGKVLLTLIFTTGRFRKDWDASSASVACMITSPITVGRGMGFKYCLPLNYSDNFSLFLPMLFRQILIELEKLFNLVTVVFFLIVAFLFMNLTFLLPLPWYLLIFFFFCLLLKTLEKEAVSKCACRAWNVPFGDCLICNNALIWSVLHLKYRESKCLLRSH